VEDADAPFSAHAVATMNLQTDVGKATVTQVCALFGISREAYYAARRPPVTRAAGEPLPLPATAGVAAPRSGRPSVTAAALEAGIRAVVRDNPAWGVRKVWATLRHPPHGLQVGKRRVWAMMKALGLTLPADGPCEPEPRRGPLADQEPNRRWATDLTTVTTADDGVVAVVPVIDCGCRSVLAVAVTKSQEAPFVLAPVRRALTAAFRSRSGVPHWFELRTDHGPQYTGGDCELMCKEWGVVHTFAPVGCPTGNAVAERLIRTMKEECIWLRDWRSAAELRTALEAWMRHYNASRPHQSLDWQTPNERRVEHLGEDAIAA
jgi:putative transposase